jgi:hypothetical protein
MPCCSLCHPPPLQIHALLLKISFKMETLPLPKKQRLNRYGQTASVSRMIAGHPLPAIRKMQRTAKLLHKSAMLSFVSKSLLCNYWWNKDVICIFARFLYSTCIHCELLVNYVLSIHNDRLSHHSADKKGSIIHRSHKPPSFQFDLRNPSYFPNALSASLIWGIFLLPIRNKSSKICMTIEVRGENSSS